MPDRFAEVHSREIDRVRAYLPANYSAELYAPFFDDDPKIIIRRRDVAGWTLDDYVIPRLASGFIHAFEVFDD